jgi:hypothetical protein
MITQYVTINGIRYAVMAPTPKPAETDSNKTLALPPEAYLGEVL